jgi:hypothetical protein
MNKQQAFTPLRFVFSSTTVYRLYKRAALRKVRINRFLRKCVPAQMPEAGNNEIVRMVLRIKIAIKNKRNPIAAFQLLFKTSFL